MQPTLLFYIQKTRKISWHFFLLLIICGSLACTKAKKEHKSPKSSEQSFEEISEGIHYLELKNDLFKAHVFRIQLLKNHFSLRPAKKQEKLEDLSKIVGGSNNILAINASFFDTDFNAMGMARDKDSNNQRAIIKKWSSLIIDNSGAQIRRGDNMSILTSESLVIQGLPRLVDNGKSAHFKDSIAERSLVCLEKQFINPKSDVKQKNQTYHTITLLQTSAINLNILAKYLRVEKQKNGLNCQEAMNFDGGPSSQLIVNFKKKKIKIEGRGQIPNALIISRK